MKRISALVLAALMLGCGGGTDSGKSSSAKSGKPGDAGKTSKVVKQPAKKKKNKTAQDAAIQRMTALFVQANSESVEDRDKALGLLDGEAALSESLVSVMKSDNEAARRGLLYYLIVRVDPNDREMLKAVVVGLGDKDKTVRSRALQLVREFRDEWVKPVFPDVAKLLSHQHEPDRRNRAKAARLLGSKRQVAAATYPAIVRAAKEDPNWQVRSACLVAAQQVGSAAANIELFADRLKSDKEPRVRRVAAARMKLLGRKTLRNLGAKAKVAVNSLVEALGDPKEAVRGAAIDALVSIGRPAVDPLVAQLNAKDKIRRRWTILALGMLGRHSKRAEPELRKLLEDKDPAIRKLTTAALKAIQ